MSVIRKELFQHGRALLFLFLAILVALVILLQIFQRSPSALSVLEIARSYMISLMPLVALVVGHKLVASEYMSGTINFIGALPVSARTVIAGKYVVGLVYLQFISLVVLSLVLQLGLSTENIDLRFVSILLIRCGATVLVIWSLVFALSFFGSLKIPLYCLLFVVVLLLYLHTSFDVENRGPLGLMSSRLFAFETREFPWQQIVESLVLALVFTAIGFSMALLDHGRAALALAHGMGRSETVAVVVVLLFLMTLMQFLQRDEAGAAYEFSGDSHLQSEQLQVAVQYQDESLQPAAQALLPQIESSVGQLLVRFELVAIPALRLSLEPHYVTTSISTFPPEKIHRQRMISTEEVDGVLVKTSLDTTDPWQRAQVHVQMIRELVLDISNARADFEPQGWLLDGFSWWWVLESAEQTEREVLLHHLSERLPVAYQQALAMFPGAEGVRDDNVPAIGSAFARWNSTREQLGTVSSAAMAFTYFSWLLNRDDSNSLLALVQRRLLQSQPLNSLPSLQNLLHPVSGELEKMYSDTQDNLLSQWSDHYALAPVKSYSGYRLEQLDLTDSGFKLLISSQHPIDTSQQSLCLLLHKDIPAFDLVLDETDLEWHEFQCEDTEPLLRGLYSRGDRIFLAVETVSAELPDPVRIFVDRIVVE